MVVRNTVVRVTININGKLQILGTHSPQTPESIDLKFDLDDYVGYWYWYDPIILGIG